MTREGITVSVEDMIDSFQLPLVLTFDLNHNFRYLVKSKLNAKYSVLYELD